MPLLRKCGRNNLSGDLGVLDYSEILWIKYYTEAVFCMSRLFHCGAFRARKQAQNN